MKIPSSIHSSLAQVGVGVADVDFYGIAYQLGKRWIPADAVGDFHGETPSRGGRPCCRGIGGTNMRHGRQRHSPVLVFLRDWR
jgi:hypothetical protein